MKVLRQTSFAAAAARVLAACALAAAGAAAAQTGVARWLTAH